MACAVGNSTECPVCHDGFDQPKLLPCAHLVCRKCVINWLEKYGDQSVCPLCRAPMIPENLKDMDDLPSQVDALPTNMAAALVAESEKTLSTQHVCSCCRNAESSLLCLQCSMKLCTSCAKLHSTFPYHQGHVTEKLCDLTAEQLAAKRQMFCEDHKTKLSELYCTNHEQLLCVECVSTSHSKCSELKGILDMAPVKREQLKPLIDKIGIKMAAVTAKVNELNTEMTDGQAKFKAMRSEVKAIFEDLQSSLETQCQKLYDEIQELEDTYLAERKSQVLDLQKLEAALSAHKMTAKQLVASAPDAALLAMLGKFKQRLEGLEAEKLPDYPKSTPGRLVLSTAAVNLTKKALQAVVGVVNESHEDGPAHDWNLWCDKCRPEGTFSFTIDNISKLKSRVYSPPYMIRNLPWKIAVRPVVRGQGDERKKTMGIYMRCNDDSTSVSWSCKARREYRLLSALPGGKPHCRGIHAESLYCQENNAWGFSDFIAWDDLMDPGLGYVQDDKITVEVTIKADTPQGLS